MSISLLLARLKQLQVSLQLKDGQLSISAPEGVLTPELIQELKKEKPAITSFLRNLQGGNYRKIKPVPLQEHYQVSHAQRRLWLMDQFGDTTAVYNIPMICNIRGNLDIAAMEKAFQTVVQRHESLRTVFLLSDGEPRQKILPASAADCQLLYEDLQALPDPSKAAWEKIQHVISTPFNLQEGPLLRVCLLRVAPQVSLFAFCIHHIVADEWSMQLLVKEILALYDACSQGIHVDTAPLEIQYKDYAAWQLESLNESGGQEQRNYWLEHLKGPLPVLELPADQPRPPVQTYNGERVVTIIPAEKQLLFATLVQQRTASVFMGLVAIVKTLLYRYTGQEDLIVGTPVAGREHPDLEDQIGFYVNTLVLRTQLDGKKGFNALLDSVKDMALKAYANQHYPFNLLVEELGMKRDISRSPIFDVMVVLQDANESIPLKLPGVEVQELDIPLSGSKFDLTFYFKQKPEGLQVELEYNKDIFSRTRIERMAAHLEGLLESAAQSPDMPIAELRYIQPAEAQLILEHFNDTAVEFPAFTPVPALIARQAALHPERTALIAGGSHLSYGELERKATLLAAYLQQQRKPGDQAPVGILLERSVWLPLAILGVLQSGVAYLPLDYNAPAERIGQILHASGASVVLTSEALLERLSGYEGQTVIVSGASIYDHTTIPQLPAISPDAAAYVIYTSGSTGQPKGVVIGHAALYNLMQAMSRETGISAEDKWLAVTTASFDMSVVELLLPLVNGSQLVVATGEEVYSTDALQALLDDGITMMQATPGMWHLLTESGWKGDPALKIITGGEALGISLAQRLLDRCHTLWNMYGPTETTVYATWHKVRQAADAILIGRGISNMKAYVLDASRQLLPTGVPGRLFVSGAGLSDGYLGQAELTAGRFIPNPFLEGQLMYDTGDICSWTEEGYLRYYGRGDHQLKIRGYRIEPGEIEHILLQYAGVNHAIVCAFERENEKYLAAYYTSGDNVPEETIQQHLRRFLPDYMVPAYVLRLEEFPLTPNGKVDRSLLPEPERKQSQYVAPRNKTEQLLATIWEEVLGVERVGITDNFFALGGHSLKAILVLSRIQKELSLKLELRDLFMLPTLADLYAEIEIMEWARDSQYEKLSTNKTDEIIL
ncbi:amino acid adenylation domain-containing protein [Chitinophaga filiformis]|uniref:Amino acid adenylation domain-containing protein n=1 Tax=Chitinophaga filiformis TaxID=104663 RepID=A0ABY4I726_CHIFI|nr:amino acid adenylation domain-containing protein [Chitinophaga filiformis]UPK71695.1 amino acid adenylation domain-containing protein [Chitinophaga filiformis]